MAFRYQPLFLIIPFWFFAVVHYDSIFQKNKYVGSGLLLIAALLAILNFLRLWGFLDCPF